MAAPCSKVFSSAAVIGLCQRLKTFQWRVWHSAIEVSSLGSHKVFPQNRSLHCSPATTLWAKKDSRKTPEEPVTSLPEDLEYIPKRKAKNPMMKIGYAWMIGLPTGVICFVLAKREVDKNRLKQLKIRQRMKGANEGKYESDRYGTVTKE